MATSLKEAKRMAKLERKKLKRERKARKKQQKLERKMAKIQRKIRKKEAKLERKMAREGIEPEFETVQAEDVEEVPEFEVIAEEVEEATAEREIPDLPVDTSRIPEIERKMDYLLKGQSGVVQRFREKYGESLDVPVAPQVEHGTPSSVAVPEVPETTPEPAVATAETTAAVEEGAASEEEKREKAPSEKVPFFAFTKWRFLQSRVRPKNAVVRLILIVIDLVLLIVRIPLGIVVMILRKILGLFRRKSRTGDTSASPQD